MTDLRCLALRGIEILAYASPKADNPSATMAKIQENSHRDGGENASLNRASLVKQRVFLKDTWVGHSATPYWINVPTKIIGPNGPETS